MRAAGLLDRGPAGQTVADDLAAGCQMALGQPLDLLLAEALDHAQPQPLGPALGRGLDRGHEGLLARSTLDLPPGSGGMGSERHAALSMVIPSMLALASNGVR